MYQAVTINTGYAYESIKIETSGESNPRSYEHKAIALPTLPYGKIKFVFEH